MEEKKKVVPSFDISVFGQGDKGHVEINSSDPLEAEKTNEYWRRNLDRKKDCFLTPEILQDMQETGLRLAKPSGDGRWIGKYDFISLNLSANPKSFQTKGDLSSYKSFLIGRLKKSEKDLERFKGKELLVYIVIYLRKERMKTNDVDNFVKPILDALKVYTGDDSKVVNVIADKKEIPNYHEADMDFIEQAVVYVTYPSARGDLFK